MKIRKGFVSNSSTSSFVCDVCGEECAGRDIGLSECEMFQCKNDHIICIEHEIQVTKEMKREMLRNYTSNYSSEEVVAEVRKQANTLPTTGYELEDYFDEIFTDYTYESPPERCPICQFQEISSKEAIQYIFKKNNTTKEEVMKEMKNSFSNYSELQKYLKIPER